MNKFLVNRISYISEDFDEFGALLQNGNVEEMILESGTFNGVANFIQTPNIIVGNFKSNKKVQQVGTGVPGFITFVIWDPKVFFSWRKFDLNKGMIGVLWKNEHQSVTGAGLIGLPISIRECYFEKICENSGNIELYNKLKKSEVLYVSENQLNQIRNLVRYVTEQGKLDDKSLYKLVEENLIELLMKCLLATMPYKTNNENTSQKFSKIIDYIHANLSDITTVYKICENTDIPERTIRRLINKRYQVSPKEYLTKLRLNEVRKNLKNNTINSNVVQTASEYNFWHMGQFSRDYKSLFGELPSETISNYAT